MLHDIWDIYAGEKTRGVGDSNLTCPPSSPSY